MFDLPPIRQASFVQVDLMRSTPRQSTASEQAKRMMGPANVMAGKDIRANASTQCIKCGRWHRPGTVCPRMAKTLDIEALLHHGLLEKGVVTTKPKSGNPYHDSRTGKFAARGGGGSPKAISSGWTADKDGAYSAMGGRAKLSKQGKGWQLELDGEVHKLPKKASFKHAEKIIQEQASKKVADLSAKLDKLKALGEKQGQPQKKVEQAKQRAEKAKQKVADLSAKLDEIKGRKGGDTPDGPPAGPPGVDVPEKEKPAPTISAGGREFEQDSPGHKAYTEARAQGGTVGDGLTAANAVEKQGSPAADDIFVGQQQFQAGTPGHETYQDEKAKGASSGFAAKEAKAADDTGIDIAHLMGGGDDKGAAAAPAAAPAKGGGDEGAAPSPFHTPEAQAPTGDTRAAKDQRMSDAYSQALATGATPKQAEAWALNQGYPEHFPAPKDYQGPPPESMAGLTGPNLYLDTPGTDFSSGMSQGQAMGAGMDTQGGTMPATVNTAQQGTTNLLNQAPTEKPPTPAEQRQKLEDSSQQLQGQQQGYFGRLRDWMSQYVR
jgi:hypothetical protein